MITHQGKANENQKKVTTTHPLIMAKIKMSDVTTCW